MTEYPQGLQIEYVEAVALAPYENNARTHSEEQVAQIVRSIEQFGWTNPILIDEADGIIAGHGRLMAANQIGLARVPCIRLAGLSADQKRALVLADNKLALNAGWDFGLLAGELQALIDAGFDAGLTGFGADEIDSIIRDVDGESEGDGTAEGRGESDPPAVTVSRYGDIWELGEHTLVCGASGLDAADKVVKCWQDHTGELATLESTGDEFDDLQSNGRPE